MPMDSMKASLRLMRSSRSISYWDLGAAGMFDGIFWFLLVLGAVLRELFCLRAVSRCARTVAMSEALFAVARRARRWRRVGCLRLARQTVLYGVRSANLRGFRAARHQYIGLRGAIVARTQHWCGCADHNRVSQKGWALRRRRSEPLAFLAF